MTPTVEGDTLVCRQGEQEHVLTVGTAAWFAWLETASTFSFVSALGRFTARREQSGHKRGGWYWKAYSKRHGKLSSHYLGKSEALTLERLQAAAQALADTPAGISPVNDVNTAVPPARRRAQRAPGNPFTPLLSAKLHVPRLRAQLVSRPELTGRLQEGIQGVLTLISAPAGFGKTTLLAQWRATSRMPVAWLSLETEDNEPVRFFSYLIAALQMLDPGVGLSTLGLLQTPQPAMWETVLTLLTNDLAASQTEDFALVLDDYHLITAEPIHRSVTFLLEHLPPRMHLVLATRSDPPLPLARLRASGQLYEVRAADLRFATEEASTFLRAVMRLVLSQEEVALVQSRTEGWIAGLQFAALSLRGRSDVSAYLAAFSGSHRYVLDYLSEEVLTRQDASVQSFLLYTSVLDRLSGPLCDAVTGKPGSQAMLEALEHANLFVVSLDDERHWYRYHHLFAEVLMSHLQQAEPALVPVLHRRASIWYEEHGFVAEAVQHALAANDFDTAARFIEKDGWSLVRQGQIHTVLGWLNALPDAVMRTHPLLCVYHAPLLLAANQIEAAQARLQDAERLIQADILAEETRVARVWLVLAHSDISSYSGDLVSSIAFAHQALDFLPEAEVKERAAATLGMTQAYLVSGDVTPAMERLVAAAVAPARHTGNPFTYLRSITNLARLQVLQGHLRQALVTYREAERVTPGQPGLGVRISSSAYHFGMGDLLVERNDVEAAEHLLTEGIDVVKQTLLVEADVVVLGYFALARLHRARGEYGRAIATLESFAHLARERHFVPHLLTRGAAVRAQIELAQGNLAAALRWLDECGLSTEDDELSYPREGEYLTLARVCIAQGRLDPAGPFLSKSLHLLERLREDAEAKARMGSVLEILILEALAFTAQSKGTEALAVLERALTQASAEGYIRLFVDEGEAMVALLRQAYARGMAPDYVATLLSACGKQAPAAPSRAFPLVELLTERELAVLRLLVAGLSNAAVAQELVITVGTVKRHVNSIYTKLGVTSRTQAVARAHVLHLL